MPTTAYSVIRGGRFRIFRRRTLQRVVDWIVQLGARGLSGIGGPRAAALTLSAVPGPSEPPQPQPQPVAVAVAVAGGLVPLHDPEETAAGALERQAPVLVVLPKDAHVSIDVGITCDTAALVSREPEPEQASSPQQQPAAAADDAGDVKADDTACGTSSITVHDDGQMIMLKQGARNGRANAKHKKRAP